MMATRQVSLVLLLAAVAQGWYVRQPRDIEGGGGGFSGSGGGGGAGAYSGASSSAGSFSSSSGTNVNPGPGGYGNFNAFAGMSSFPSGPGYGGGAGLYREGEGGGPGGGGGFFNFPGFNPFIPQYGQPYPYTPFPTFPAPFDFSSFLQQYFQNLQHFQAQAQQAAQSGNGVYESGPGYSVWSYHYPRFIPVIVSGGLPLETNEVGGGGVGGIASATYSPQGGYGSANVYPAPAGALDNRFGGDEEGAPQNSVGGGPVGSVSGKFPPPGGSSFGVFTSSVSGSSDVNGKKSGFKQSTIGVNDNGKVTTYTAHDP